jgi:queuine tRNA-ribosyltransferase
MIGFELSAPSVPAGNPPGNGAARAGLLHTPRGEVRTPVFVPVGTQATVKAMTPEELEGLGAEILLANTYHLHLRPGEAVIRRLGGLHRFMHWERALLTDSGGYQVVSLFELTRVTEEGVAFRSHLDGSPLFLSPEGAVAIQEALGSDIMMVLDRPIPATAGERELAEALALTTRWAARGKAAVTDGGEAALFGIVQGGTLPHLRRRGAEELAAIGFDGYALGGLSLGESTEAIHDTVAFTAPLLPEDRPRYLMGMGEPEDLLAAVGAGIDLFDCVLPTRNARNGTLYTRRGKLNIKAARFKDDPAPLEPDCPCPACRHYSRAYLRHLHAAGEILSMRLNTWHNLHFYLDLMRQARRAILQGHYLAWAREFLEGYRAEPA